MVRKGVKRGDYINKVRDKVITDTNAIEQDFLYQPEKVSK